MAGAEPKIFDLVTRLTRLYILLYFAYGKHSDLSKRVRRTKFDRNTNRRYCTGCGNLKTLDEFYKMKAASLGVMPRCIVCITGGIRKRKGTTTDYSLKYEPEWRAKKIKQELCTRCGKNTIEQVLKLGRWTGRKRCFDCLRKGRNEDHLRNKQSHTKLLELYGVVCACCGENNQMFLTVDHKNNDGARERKIATYTGKDTRWAYLLQHKRPDIQTLCYNCNCGKQRCRGTCPHLIVAEGDSWNMVLTRNTSCGTT